MKRVPNGRYTKEFREEAVKLVIEGRLSVPEAGRRLSLHSSTYIEVFYNRQRIQAKLGFLSPAIYEQQFYMRKQLVP